MRVDISFVYGDSLSFMDSRRCHIVHDDRNSVNYLIVYNGTDDSVMKVINLDLDDIERIDFYG